MPFQFKFMGSCLLESLKEERAEYKYQRGLNGRSMSKFPSLFNEQTPVGKGYYERAINSSFMAPAVTPPKDPLSTGGKYRQGCDTYI